MEKLVFSVTRNTEPGSFIYWAELRIYEGGRNTGYECALIREYSKSFEVARSGYPTHRFLTLKQAERYAKSIVFDAAGKALYMYDVQLGETNNQACLFRTMNVL